MRTRLRPPQDVQLELFCPLPKIPSWPQVPPEARQRVVSLLARMLREFQGQHADDAREVDHE